MVVNVFEKETLKLAISGGRGIAEASEAVRRLTNLVHGGSTGGPDTLLSNLNQTSCQGIQNALEGFVEDEFLTRAVMRGIDLRVDFAKKWDFLA